MAPGKTELKAIKYKAVPPRISDHLLRTFKLTKSSFSPLLIASSTFPHLSTLVTSLLLKLTMGKKRVLVGYGVDIDAVAGWLGSYGGEDSSNDISRGIDDYCCP